MYKVTRYVFVGCRSYTLHARSLLIRNLEEKCKWFDTNNNSPKKFV